MDKRSIALKLPVLKPVASVRVKEYLKAYSSSLLSTRSDYLKPPKTTERMLKSLSKNQISTQTEKKAYPDDPKKKAGLQYDISVAKSDKLEIIRDLSTYEFELSNQIAVQERLKLLDSHLGTLPELYLQFQGISSENESIADLITNGLKSLHNLKNPHPEPLLSNEKFEVREQNTLRKTILLHKKIAIISGIRALVQVKGDIFLENFCVSILTGKGEICMNVPIKISAITIDTLNHSVKATEVIEGNLIPFMYFMCVRNEITLMFDEGFIRDKISVVVDLKNYGKVSVFVWQFEEALNVQIIEPKFEKRINRANLFEGQNISQVSLTCLKRFLTSHLRYIGKKGDIEIEWVEDFALEFSKKEMKSKLMNEEYVKESLGTQSFNRIWQKNIVVNSVEYLVQCIAYGSLKKLLVTSGVKTIEIKQGSEIFNYIFALQSIDILKNSTTLIQSLELKKIIKSFFI